MERREEKRENIGKSLIDYERPAPAEEQRRERGAEASPVEPARFQSHAPLNYHFQVISRGGGRFRQCTPNWYNLLERLSGRGSPWLSAGPDGIQPRGDSGGTCEFVYECGWCVSCRQSYNKHSNIIIIIVMITVTRKHSENADLCQWLKIQCQSM